MVLRESSPNNESLTMNNQSLLKVLNPLRNSKTIILGVGNVLKGDDALGPLVCERLKPEKVSAEVIDAATVPENYIQTIIKKAPQNLLIIDAIDFAAKPGTIKIFEAEKLNSFAISTHTLSPRIFINLICQSIKLKVYFLGIQPAQTHLGSPISQRVQKSIDVLSCILTDIFQRKIY
ncbi:MAG: hydrogenase 3 maturation endopeptidase HyCI [Sedimentisphaerales bacterium]|nr:hydrogenase 3 maturation endopeptidase HyCI [Sedimentisphaerales bacterium]